MKFKEMLEKLNTLEDEFGNMDVYFCNVEVRHKGQKMEIAQFDEEGDMGYMSDETINDLRVVSVMTEETRFGVVNVEDLIEVLEKYKNEPLLTSQIRVDKRDGEHIRIEKICSENNLMIREKKVKKL